MVLTVAALGVALFGQLGVAPARTPPDPEPTPAPKVVLRDPGDAPREPLRWTIPPPGTSRTTTMTMEMEFGGDAAAVSGPAGLEMVMEMETTVVGVTPEGAATVAGRILSASSPSDPAADAALAPLLGDFAWESDITPDGRTLATRADIPEGLDPTSEGVLEQILPQVQQATRPFPVEPVGTGATWRILEEIELGGVPVTQRTDQTLERRDGNEVEISVRMRQTVEPGPIDLPGVPPEARVTVRKWRMTGKGNQVLDLAKPFDPVDSHLEGHMLQRLRVNAEGATETITTEIDLTVSFEG
ncbi:MAG TPA: hypothetical protein VF152_02620 [Acidimicrobiia bacterium]